MVRNVASEMAELEPEDFYLLSGLEHGMRFSRWVAEGKLPEFSRLDGDEVGYRLDRCEDRGLVERKTIQYTGYRLTFEGYDALALRAFAERETIDGVGAPLGVGKESDVYEARSYKPLALKFHREGYTNFREVRKERDYTSDNRHVSWFYTARKAAEREYGALEALYPDVRARGGQRGVRGGLRPRRHVRVQRRGEFGGRDGVRLAAGSPDDPRERRRAARTGRLQSPAVLPAEVPIGGPRPGPGGALAGDPRRRVRERPCVRLSPPHAERQGGIAPGVNRMSR